jgi:hypothetical protein
MTEDLITSKSAGVITLREPMRLLDNLGNEWRKPAIESKLGLRLPPGIDWGERLSSNSSLKWAVTGESSVARYGVLSQGGPRRIAVSDTLEAMILLGGKPEPVTNFADVELLKTDEPGFFFGNEIDVRGIRWASKFQTWLELQAGDARQQETAKGLREQILKEAQK